MLPAPPGLLSTMTCWPRLSLIFEATVRATISDEPPGANGMISLIGFVGNVCAAACAASAANRTPSPLTRARKGRGCIFDFSMERLGRAADYTVHDGWVP